MTEQVIEETPEEEEELEILEPESDDVLNE